MSRGVWRHTAVASVLALGFVLSPGPVAAQDEPYQVSGQVLAEESQLPLPSAQVAIRGTNLGALTNADGRFSITASLNPGTYTIEFSFVGRETGTQQLTLGTQRNVILEPVSLGESAVALRELVVSATGVASERRELGNSVASVSGEQISQAPAAATIDQALQGKVPGAVISETSGQAGGGVTIRLRGVSSILGGAEPLIVVDGVIIDNSNAALISLAANAGRGSASLTNRLADISPADIERIEVLKGAAAAALYGARANSGVIQIFTKQGQQGEPRFTFRSELSLNETPDMYDLNMSPFAGLGDVAFIDPSLEIGDPIERHDIQDEIFRTGFSNNTQLSISGGANNVTYYVSGSRVSEEGIVVGNDYARNSVLGKVTANLTDRIDVGLSGNYIQSQYSFIPEGEQTTGVLTSIIFTPPSFDPFFDAELGRFPYNPILRANVFDVVQNWDFNEDVNRVVARVEANYRPTDDISLHYLLGFDDYRDEFFRFQPPLSTSLSDDGSASKPTRISRQINHDLTAAHHAQLGETTSLESVLGFRYLEDKAEVTSVTASDLPFGQRLVAGADQFVGQSISEIHTAGGFIQEQLSLGDEFFVTAGLNAEASSAFGEDERWQFFPRVGLSWVLGSGDDFETSALGGLFSSLRLRAAYGETGGQPPGAYTRFENYGDVAYAGLPGLVPSSTAGNPNLEPEREREIEGGFDAGFLADRIQWDLTGYWSETSDLVLGIRLQPSRAVQQQFDNIGTLRNWGIETSINTINLSRADVTWRSRLSFAWQQNEVTELVTASDTLTFDYLNAVIEGQPVGVFYGWFYERDANGEIVIDPATGLGARAFGEDGTALKKILGNPAPDLTASFLNSIDLAGNWQLQFLLDGRFGNQVADFSRRISEFFGAADVTEDEIARARAIAAGEDVDPLQYTLNAARLLNYEEYVEDGDFVKLREVALSYELGNVLGGFLGAEAATVTLAGRNLYTWTKYGGLDPEINLFAGSTTSQGVDFATTPIPRSFAFSVNLLF